MDRRLWENIVCVFVQNRGLRFILKARGSCILSSCVYVCVFFCENRAGLSAVLGLLPFGNEVLLNVSLAMHGGGAFI